MRIRFICNKITKQFRIGGAIMWVVTVYSNSNIAMFEFDKEEDARSAFENIQGCKVISEVIYFNDERFHKSVN